VDPVARDQGAGCADVKARRVVVGQIEACVRVRAAQRVTAEAPVVVSGDGGAELGRRRSGKAQDEKANQAMGGYARSRCGEARKSNCSC
jgi:hypothetical protein